jgi:hypothetical protein
MKFRNELDTLKNEVSALRERLLHKKADEPKSADRKGEEDSMLQGFSDQIKDLLEEAEDKASAHPAATLAGVFALGVAVGRLSAR